MKHATETVVKAEFSPLLVLNALHRGGNGTDSGVRGWGLGSGPPRGVVEWGCVNLSPHFLLCRGRGEDAF